MADVMKFAKLKLNLTLIPQYQKYRHILRREIHRDRNIVGTRLLSKLPRYQIDNEEFISGIMKFAKFVVIIVTRQINGL